MIAQIFGIAAHLKFRLKALFQNAFYAVSAGRMKSRNTPLPVEVTQSSAQALSFKALISRLFTSA